MLGGRLTVRLRPLEPRIGVRIPASQPLLSRGYSMKFPAAALLVIPLFALAQDQKAAPPPEVDKALRERATAYLQYQVEGNFRKAYDLVAEESKDFYFAAEKSKILTFKINEITYADNFTKAAVQTTTTRLSAVAGHPVELPSVASDIWKLEDGKWVW